MTQHRHDADGGGTHEHDGQVDQTERTERLAIGFGELATERAQVDTAMVAQIVVGELGGYRDGEVLPGKGVDLVRPVAAAACSSLGGWCLGSRIMWGSGAAGRARRYAVTGSVSGGCGPGLSHRDSWVTEQRPPARPIRSPASQGTARPTPVRNR
jgi:hypothetical protein